MAIEERYESVMARLPPGPWHADGKWIVAGTRRIAVALDGRGAEVLAEELARLPATLEIAMQMRDADLAVQQAEDAKSEAADLRDDLAAAQEEIEELKGQIVQLRAEIARMNPLRRPEQ